MPSSISKLTPSSARTEPNVFVSSWARSSAIVRTLGESSGAGLEEREHLVILREAPLVLLREDELPVGDDVVLALRPLERDGVVTCVRQHGRETRGPSVVAASDGAVEDLDAHPPDATRAAVGGARRSRRRPRPGGSVPYARPPSPPSRVAQKASATSAGACRTRSEACSASASRSTSRRAPASSAASSSPAEPGEGRVEVAVGAARALELGHERLPALRLPGERAEDIEAVDVARPLPHRVDRALAVEAGQDRLLDVAVAAEALERLGDERRRRLADPELRHGGRETAEGVVALVEGARQAHGRRRRRLRVEAEVGEHVLHQRLLREQAARTRHGGRRDGSPRRPPAA